MILPSTVQTVTIRSDRVLNRFDPHLALGAGIDGGDEGETKRVFTPRNLRAMSSAGLGGLSYRLRTELAGEAWHWNPSGHFSEGDRGYWVSEAKLGAPIRRSFGYRLPRRGDTYDQANNDGYSRLVDGRMDTFWKSNPYLDDRNPQWVTLDLRRSARVDAVRIRWADPFALRLRFQFWDGESRSDFGAPRPGSWRSYPQGEAKGRGGMEMFRLGEVGHAVRYVRVQLLASSHTPLNANDPRDAKGFAIRELSVGRLTSRGFVDAVRHEPDHSQTACFVSSTDPWHRASDRDPNVEQPGLDLVAQSPLSRGRPMLLPVPVLYGTPEDAAALGKWLRARHFLVRAFEMGEEPDGQICAPEDYGALYLRMVDVLRTSYPRAIYGGPAFQSVEYDYGGWALPTVTPSGSSWKGGWGERLVRFFKERGRSKDLGFLSFEWYPFDAVWGDSAAQLAKHPGLLRTALARLRVPGIPLLITEYGYSAFAGPAEVDLPGALLNLDLVGTFLAEGGRAAFLYGYPPAPLMSEKRNVWGNLALFLSGDDGQWRYRLPTYWAARMMTQDWCGIAPKRLPLEARHEHKRFCALLATRSLAPLVSAFALRRLDGHLSVLLLNKDPHQRRTLRLTMDGRPIFGGNLVQYGPAQFAWKAKGENGHPLRSRPPVRSRFAGTIDLPPYSITVATF